MSECRWSGWPGAFCLDCGREDPREVAMADGLYEIETDIDGNLLAVRFIPEITEESLQCKEPGSNRCNPYVNKRKNLR